MRSSGTVPSNSTRNPKRNIEKIADEQAERYEGTPDDDDKKDGEKQLGSRWAKWKPNK